MTNSVMGMTLAQWETFVAVHRQDIVFSGMLLCVGILLLTSLWLLGQRDAARLALRKVGPHGLTPKTAEAYEREIDELNEQLNTAKVYQNVLHSKVTHSSIEAMQHQVLIQHQRRKLISAIEDGLYVKGPSRRYKRVKYGDLVVEHVDPDAGQAARGDGDA
jgi:hypothetical protein